MAQGELTSTGTVHAGEMVIFDQNDGTIDLKVEGHEAAIFVLGSAIPHSHKLHLGNYCVHTLAMALAEGEGRIAELRLKLIEAGDRRTKSGSTPVF